MTSLRATVGRATDTIGDAFAMVDNAVVQGVANDSKHSGIGQLGAKDRIIDQPQPARALRERLRGSRMY